MESLSSSGHIELILGPMFAGKTTELLRRVRRYNHAKKNCLIIKYGKDQRYSEEASLLSTHDKHMVEAVPCGRLMEVIETMQSKFDDFQCIGIDEGQFYPDLLEFCEIAANSGKVVIVSALDGTFQRQPFGSVCSLVPLAENVTKLSAVCMICQNIASFSKRICGGNEIEVIGGADKYIAVCRQCFFSDDSASPSSPVAAMAEAQTTPVPAEQPSKEFMTPKNAMSAKVRAPAVAAAIAADCK